MLRILGRRCRPEHSFGACLCCGYNALQLRGIWSGCYLWESSRLVGIFPHWGRREAHTQGVYLHHTSGGPSSDSVSVTLGLLKTLQSFRPGLGFFCPIDKTPEDLRRSNIMKGIFKFEDDLQAMHGVTQARAYELTESDRMDDLMEEIFRACEAYKARHDFIVVEGASLKKTGDDTSLLNARIASTLGLPVLMVTNARKAAGMAEKRVVRWEEFDWERDLIHSANMSSVVFRRNYVEVLGSIVHRLPPVKGAEDKIRKLLHELRIRFLGAIPEDSVLQSVKVQEMVTVLGATVLFGSSNAAIKSVEANQFILATSMVSDFFTNFMSNEDASTRTVVICAKDCAEILLNAINLHQSKAFPRLAGIVLTGGADPPVEADLLMKGGASERLPPVILSPEPLFETAVTLADLEGQILPDSREKIERAEVLFNCYVETDYVIETLSQERIAPMNPVQFQASVFSRAKQLKQTIVLPEGDEPRTVQAAGILLQKGLCDLILLGEHEKIEEVAMKLQVDLGLAVIMSPSQSVNLEKYVHMLFEARKHKGMTCRQARELLVHDMNYFGTCMVASGDADGMVSGAFHTTADTIRPALQLIKTAPGLPIASSVFFMCLQDKVLVFGDCAINANPTSDELAMIAIASADTAASFGVQPRVAFLSYATGDSNSGPLIQKVIDAVAIATKRRPDLYIDGPLQYDAAVNPDVAKIKLKGKESPVAGKATVLIFPDLNSGNIVCKAVQQSTGAIAMGPVIQGLRKPVNDLSRGCTVNDIVATVAITAVQAGAYK